MAEILTKKGQRILVDDGDFENLNQYSWCIVQGYAYRAEPTGLVKPRQRPVYMHRIILGLAPGDGQEVDHRNGDRSDNRRENLRLCTRAENTRNARRHYKNASGFKGVCFYKPLGKFKAYIQFSGKPKHLGYFDTAELAHEFYCLSADMLFGEFANHG